MYRSKKILDKPEWCFNRSVFKSLGYSNDDLDKPIIGIANAWNDLVPGHANLRQLANGFAKAFIKRAERCRNSA